MPEATLRPVSNIRKAGGLRVRSRMLRAAAIGLAAVLTLTGCATGDGETSDDQAQQQLIAVEIPDTAAGEATQRVLDALNAEQDSAAADWAGIFDETFTAEVSDAEFAELLNTQLRPAAPFTATAYSGAEREAVTRLESDATDPFDLTIALDADGLTTGLFFTPAAASDWHAPATFDELQERLGDISADVRVIVIAEDELAKGDAGSALLDIDSETSAPTGSAFKLYVLYALAQAIDEGVIDWGDELEITDAVRSLPSGELQDEPNGTRVTVREAAGKMISISDNTATDMLMTRLGRERVEAAVNAAGHHDPAAMIPMPTTREFFQIGWGDPSLLGEWRDGDAAQRRALLERIAAETIDPQSISIGVNALWPDGVEWFASPRDLARVHVALAALEDPEINAILTENPGVSPGLWGQAAFKGGSSPGVLVGSWLVTDRDGHSMVVVLQASTLQTTALALQQTEFFRLAQSALELAYESR